MSAEREPQPDIRAPGRQQRTPAETDVQAEQGFPTPTLGPTNAPPELPPNPTALQLRRSGLQRAQRNLGNAHVARMLAQRQDAPPASAPGAPTQAATATSSLIVDDAVADVQPGQMKKSAFLA